MYVRTKICGIRSKNDLGLALDAGVDAVGFISGVTHRSEDALSPDGAKDLVSRTPPFVSRVLVTHLDVATEIMKLAEHVGADTIQVHGLVSPKTLKDVFSWSRGRFSILKAVHVTGREVLDELEGWAVHCDAVLLDTRTADRLGGTGIVHDWRISRQIVDLLGRRRLPTILAGGLNPDNVEEAVRIVAPFAIDANSGVEDEVGNKSPELSSALVSRARLAGRSLPRDSAKNYCGEDKEAGD